MGIARSSAKEDHDRWQVPPIEVSEGIGVALQREAEKRLIRTGEVVGHGRGFAPRPAL